MNTSFIGFVVLLFIATVLLIEGGYLYWHSRHGAEVKRVKARVRSLWASDGADNEPVSILKSGGAQDMPPLLRRLMGAGRLESLHRLLVQAGLNWTVKRFFSYVAVFAALGLIAGLVLHQPLPITAALAAVCGVLPLLSVRHKRARRIKVLEQQLPEASDLIARAMLAGHSFPSALGMVGDEMASPLGAEFKLAFDEINFGISMNDALQNMTRRVPIDDLRYFVIAVLIQREAGGNLAEILGKISFLIRERLKLLGNVRVLSAEGRMSAWILCLLPFGLCGVITLINPGMMQIFWTDPTGETIAGVALVMMACGIFWSRKVVRIHV
jgi:tight adherence protein B